jgi:hypothetical protein
MPADHRKSGDQVIAGILQFQRRGIHGREQFAKISVKEKPDNLLGYRLIIGIFEMLC